MGGHTGRSTARLHVCTVSNTGHPSVELGNVHALETPLSPSQWGPWAPRRGREKGLGSSRPPSGRLLSSWAWSYYPHHLYFTLKDNCFTVLCWFPQYNSMNQP